MKQEPWMNVWRACVLIYGVGMALGMMWFWCVTLALWATGTALGLTWPIAKMIICGISVVLAIREATTWFDN